MPSTPSRVPSRRAPQSRKKKPSRKQLVDELAALPYRQFADRVTRWMTANDVEHDRDRPLFHAWAISQRTVETLTDMRDQLAAADHLGADLERLLGRAETELAALLSRALWGREVPTPRDEDKRPVTYTDDDLEEIEWALEASDAEFAEAVNEWMTLGDDGSGRRVFLSPRLAARTRATIDAMLREVSGALGVARRSGAAAVAEELQARRERLEQTRSQAPATGDGRMIRIRRSVLDTIDIPEPDEADQARVADLARLDERTLRGHISQWVETGPASDEAVYFSRELVERTLSILRDLLTVALTRRARAREGGNPDQINDVERRLAAVEARIRDAKKVARLVRRENPTLSPRQGAYLALARVYGPGMFGVDDAAALTRPQRPQLVKAHPAEFAWARHRLAAGSTVDEVVAELSKKANP